ncbi:hypothetical protein ANCCAN_02984 [Ancylostoma caninum]|uniref:Uncharacterized protein n=1 Tax=Ancylostoma caninum TaxID=29170 RepID=A0A368H300_ANCCA|nr:hypothetical protein ANCCAN_02984 [Ancylostoma caninum]
MVISGRQIYSVSCPGMVIGGQNPSLQYGNTGVKWNILPGGQNPSLPYGNTGVKWNILPGGQNPSLPHGNTGVKWKILLGEFLMLRNVNSCRGSSLALNNSHEWTGYGA